ncbi:MAG TPA: hypothetical protein VFQ45_22670 [Longimicrobium sp.]|nr:hypothetical protein [Longimicrobium sp.]
MRTSAVLWLCLRLVDAIALLAPADERGGWKQEWRAELWYRARVLPASRAMGAAAAARLLVRTLGAVWDALDLRIGGYDRAAAEAGALGRRWRDRPLAASAALACVALGITGTSLVLAVGTLAARGSRTAAWASLPATGRHMVAAVAFAAGMGLLVAAAAAAHRLLADAPALPPRRARLLETLAVAAAAGILSRAALEIGPAADALAPVPELGSAWLLVWLASLAALALIHARGAPARR